MSAEILERLRTLQKKRGDSTAFSNVDEFLPWSDDVLPLLSFDEKLESDFELWCAHVKAEARTGGDDHRNALGEAIGIVNQAVTKLELQPQPTEENKILAVARKFHTPTRLR